MRYLIGLITKILINEWEVVYFNKPRNHAKECKRPKNDIISIILTNIRKNLKNSYFSNYHFKKIVPLLKENSFLFKKVLYLNGEVDYLLSTN